MRKRISFFLVLIALGITLKLSAQVAELTIPMVNNSVTGLESPTLDGFMDDVYQNAPLGEMLNWNSNESQCGGPCPGEPVPGHSGTFRMVYDEEFLYIYVEMTDDDFAELDQLVVGIDIAGQEAEYGWEGTPRNDNPFIFFSLNYKDYLSLEDGGIALLRGFEIAWPETNGDDWNCEIKVSWDSISTELAFVDQMKANGSFLFDIGSKNKYTDDNPAVGDAEFFQWAGFDNMFWKQSIGMGTIYLGEMLNKTSVNFSGLNQYSIYPNPAKNQIAVSGIRNAGSIKLMDITGKMVKSIINENAANQLNINISDCKQGIYFLHIDNYIQKVVIQ